MAGIRVNSEVVELYNQFRFGKGGMRFFTCKLSNDMTEVVLDSTGASNSSWEDMEAKSNAATFSFTSTTKRKEAKDRKSYS